MDIIAAVAAVQDALVAAIPGADFGYPIGGPGVESMWLADSISELVPSYALSTADGSPCGATFKLEVKVAETLNGTTTQIRDKSFIAVDNVIAAALPDENGQYLGGLASRIEIERMQFDPGLDDGTRFLGCTTTLSVDVGYVPA